MRKRLIAGNWKMNKHYDSAMTLVAELVALESKKKWSDIDVAIFPPAFYTRTIFEYLKNARSRIALGIQDVATTDNGAFTGELSASMAASAGAELCLIGHSERRLYQKETGKELYEKLIKALDQQLIPVFCCGEQLDDRSAGKHFEIIDEQLSTTVFKLDADAFSNVIIAYEPVWAIGTGETASPEQAQEVHAFIRNCISAQYGKEIADATRILYGGSMKPNNAKDLLTMSDVDGGLIGGASLEAEQFEAIIKA